MNNITISRYNNFIDDIIERRGRLNPIVDNDMIIERHHIVPKCMGGDEYDENNMVDLTCEEHFIAHKLFAQENPHNAYANFAYWSMAYNKESYNELTPEEYAQKVKTRKAKAAQSWRDPERREKHAEAVRRSICRPVVQLDMQNMVIAEYQSASEASRVTGVAQSSITNCCRRKIVTAGGFRWEYAEKQQS